MNNAANTEAVETEAKHDGGCICHECGMARWEAEQELFEHNERVADEIAEARRYGGEL